MFDYLRQSEYFQNMLAGSTPERAAAGDLLTMTGLDPNALQSLPLAEALDAASAAGIDTNALTEHEFFGRLDVLTPPDNRVA